MENYPIINDIYVNELSWSIDDCNSNVLRCEKVKVKPTRKQRKILKSWFPIYRKVYNQTVELIKSGEKKNHRHLRGLLKQQRSKRFQRQITTSKVQIHILDNAINDVIKAYKTCFSNLRNRNITHFRVRAKKPSVMKETITIPSETFSKRKNAFAITSLGTIKTSKPIIGTKRDSRLTWDKRTRKFTLYIPKDKKVERVTNRSEICSLDPGVRTFQTMYSADGVAKIGNKTPQKISQLIKAIESKKEHEGSKWYRKYSTRLYKKIKGIVDNMHWQTCNALCKTFDHILVGSMSTNIKSIVKRGGNINASTRQLCNLLSHYTFLTRLQSKAEQYSCKVDVINEAWTSKTCSECSHVNHTLGSAKIFNCDYCKFQYDRDYNGARNIMLKHFNLFNPIH